jgi:hypothetical protein
VSYDKLQCESFKFNAYMSPGENGNFLALLQQTLEVINGLMMKTFRACTALRQVLLPWMEILVPVLFSCLSQGVQATFT